MSRVSEFALELGLQPFLEGTVREIHAEQVDGDGNVDEVRNPRTEPCLNDAHLAQRWEYAVEEEHERSQQHRYADALHGAAALEGHRAGNGQQHQHHAGEDAGNAHVPFCAFLAAVLAGAGAGGYVLIQRRGSHGIDAPALAGTDNLVGFFRKVHGQCACEDIILGAHAGSSHFAHIDILHGPGGVLLVPGGPGSAVLLEQLAALLRVELVYAYANHRVARAGDEGRVLDAPDAGCGITPVHNGFGGAIRVLVFLHHDFAVHGAAGGPVETTDAICQRHEGSHEEDGEAKAQQ